MALTKSERVFYISHLKFQILKYVYYKTDEKIINEDL